MVEIARRSSPGPEYRVGTMLDLDLADGSLGGAIAFYSIIHLTAEELPAAFTELRRALLPDGVALLAFHAGRHLYHLDDMMGVEVSLDFHFHAPDAVRLLLEDAGLTVDWELRRQPGGSEVQTERCYLLARRSPVTTRPATEADRDFLRTLHHACYRRLVEPIWGWDEADQDRRFARSFDVAGRVIVEIAGEPIGTLRTSRDGRCLFVDDIEVAPEHQGRGIGSRMLRGVLAEADRKRLAVRLQVLLTNPARRLYQRLGFTVERETPSHALMVRPGMDSPEHP